jgi:hypothetical protein
MMTDSTITSRRPARPGYYFDRKFDRYRLIDPKPGKAHQARIFGKQMEFWLRIAGIGKCWHCEIWSKLPGTGSKSCCPACTEAYAHAREDRHLRAIARKNNERYPEKEAARTVMSLAISQGRLTRAPCEVCGSATTDGHHEDYSRPLDVHWLCRKHHAGRHREMRASSTIVLTSR